MAALLLQRVVRAHPKRSRRASAAGQDIERSRGSNGISALQRGPKLTELVATIVGTQLCRRTKPLARAVTLNEATTLLEDETLTSRRANAAEADGPDRATTRDEARGTGLVSKSWCHSISLQCASNVRVERSAAPLTLTEAD